MSQDDAKTFIHSTQKQALYLWGGLCLSLTLFYVQSQLVFVQSNPLPTSNLEWVLSLLGLVTFLMGHFFFNNYTRLRKDKFSRMSFAERKQGLLVAFVLQFVLFETLGLYGVLVSVLTQSSLKALPYVLCAYLGFCLSFPKKAKIKPFFQAPYSK